MFLKTLNDPASTRSYGIAKQGYIAAAGPDYISSFLGIGNHFSTGSGKISPMFIQNTDDYFSSRPRQGRPL